MRFVLISLFALLFAGCAAEVAKTTNDPIEKKTEGVFTPPAPKELNLGAGHVDFTSKLDIAKKNDCKARFTTTFDQLDVMPDPLVAASFLGMQLEPHSMVLNLPNFTDGKLGLDPTVAEKCNGLYELLLPYVFLDKTGPGVGKRLKNDVRIAIRFEQETEFKNLTPDKKLQVKAKAVELKMVHQIVDGGDNKRLSALIRSSTVTGTLTCRAPFTVSCTSKRSKKCTTLDIAPPKEACAVQFSQVSTAIGSGKEVKGALSGVIDFTNFPNDKKVPMHIDGIEF